MAQLHWDEARLSRLLAEVRHEQGRLLGRMEGLGFRLGAEATLTALTSEVIKSSAIEGERLDAQEVRSSVAHWLGIDLELPKAASRDVEGAVQIMLDATSASGNSEKPVVEKGYSTLPELFTSLDQVKDWLGEHDVTARFQTLEFRRKDGEMLQVVFVHSFAYSGVPLIDLYVYIANASGYRLRLANMGVQSKPGLYVASQSGDYLVLTNGNTEYLKIKL